MIRTHVRQKRAWWSVAVALCATACVADEDTAAPQEEEYDWGLPEGIPAPRVPEDNPMSEAKVELGRHLFYDVRLSGNETQSCGTCHVQSRAFTDGLVGGLGSTGQSHVRNTMSLVNVAYGATFGWAGASTLTLEKQALIPMFNEEPVELGLALLSAKEVAARFADDPLYQRLFAEAYPDQDTMALDHLVHALTSFERAIVSFDSPYDRATYKGDKDAMSEAARRGQDLFFSERLECFHCHGGVTFSDAMDHEGLAFSSQPFHNTGLYNVDDEGGYPASDRGVFDLTGRPEDMGRFKAPTLRNIAVTAPYFHDGSAATLEEVIDHYERGGRSIVRGPHIGDGSTNPYKSEFVQGFVLSDEERADLIAFLESLTDTTVLTDPRFSDPFEQAPSN